jgi:hypothetical protein
VQKWGDTGKLLGSAGLTEKGGFVNDILITDIDRIKVEIGYV